MLASLFVLIYVKLLSIGMEETKRKKVELDLFSCGFASPAALMLIRINKFGTSHHDIVSKALFVISHLHHDVVRIRSTAFSCELIKHG